MTNRQMPRRSDRPLMQQLRRFVRLRWVAGGAVVAGSLAGARWLGYVYPLAMAGVGAFVLAYNLVLWLFLRSAHAPLRAGRRRVPGLLAQAWGQLLLDLACLTILCLLTGGARSPLLGFFVFHMVFASLLLPRKMAYAGASLAMLMVAAGLGASGQWPMRADDAARFLAWVVMLLATVWLANGMTRSLRRQRHRLLAQNRRISEMSRRLRLQQQGMIQQEKMAAAGRMAAGVAHEVANPLASIDSLLQLMERRPERVRPEAVATLREQVARITQIVRRMTEFAHPGDGQSQEADLNDLIGKALEILRFDPRLKKVTVTRELAESLPRVHVVGDAVQQVIINLVINALDAVESAAEPAITIRTGFRGGVCFAEVQDNGHGIAVEHRRRLFEPFFTTKPVGKGTGLGLSISYSLVRNLGGEIAVESREGHGARFTVCLPAVPRLQASQASAHAVG